MYKITEKVALNPTVTKMVIEAPLIAKKAKPGQFIIVRPFEDSERIPLTVAGYDREAGTVDIIFQIVGGTTMELNSLKVGESVHDFVGPLGRATEVEGLKRSAWSAAAWVAPSHCPSPVSCTSRAAWCTAWSVSVAKTCSSSRTSSRPAATSCA